MINLQYVLVLSEYFKQQGVEFYLILKIENENNLFYKLSHYFSMKYPIYSRVYVKQENDTYVFPNKVISHLPGEILPFFYVNLEFYKSCFKSFIYNSTVFDKINNNKDNVIDIISKQYSDYSHTDIYLFSCVYGYLARTTYQKEILDFLFQHVETPILAAILFVAILSKSKYKEYDVIYENCLDYALSLEQLIENALFYSGNGVLSIRIHNNTSGAMSSIYNKDKVQKGYSIEISLIDFQMGNTIVDNFVQFADADEIEKLEIKKELNNEFALKNLFQPQNTDALQKYFNKPNVIIQHYGLQTISLLIKKTNSLLCVKNGENFYATNNNDMFIEQFREQYKYMSGVYYRMIIPIANTARQSVYIGLNNNQYNYSCSSYKYENFDYPNEVVTIPKNRTEKINFINALKDKLLEHCKPNHIVVINASRISGRLELEYLIKAILLLLSKKEDNDLPVYIAITELKNKALVKIALRFIALCYNFKGINKNLKSNEIFICNDECNIEVLISGDNYEDISKNLSEQRIFGTIDDDIFEELNSSLIIMNKGECYDDTKI